MTRRMGLQVAMSVVALLGVLGGCGPRSTPQRPCGESEAARATGDYMAHGGGGYDAHGGACYRSCEAGDEPACVEYRLLAQEQYWPQRLTLEGVAAVQQDCDHGHATSCAWLALPRVVERIAHERWEAEPYRGERGLGDGGPIASAEAALTGSLSTQGMELLAGATYSLAGTSLISFPVEVPRREVDYVVVAIAARAMSFTAELRGSFMSIGLGPVDLGSDVTARMLRVTWTDDALTAQLAIHADGTARGDVRYLLFGPAE